ncbi:MAG: hypothetical protein M3Y25_06010 [Thermoproteota archaeon]|nr:hypothetical protein [Thermoproteota archaeon]
MQLSDEYQSHEDNIKKNKVQCVRCGSLMGEISACHLRCFTCGAELTCSDKGNFW